MTSHERGKRIKKELAAKGWTQEAAAKELGKTFEHLNRVLNGHRVSARLLKAIEALPVREVASAP